VKSTRSGVSIAPITFATMIKIGVLGAGHLGKIHLKCLGMLPELFQLVGVYDPDKEKAEAASVEFGIAALHSMSELIAACDAVDIVTPTVSHFLCAEESLGSGKHVFIEKPITNTVEEAYRLRDMISISGLRAQVGHVERFNPAFRAASSALKDVRFIEAHRLAQFNPRGTDVSVVLDLMIHDLDIILHTVNSPIRAISASGVAVLSDTPDIANARIEFENGCVANVTASRISVKNMRKSRFFQRDAYIAIDFLEKKAEVVRMREPGPEPDPFSLLIELGPGKGKREILFERPPVSESNAIRDELEAFGQSILNSAEPPVTINDGLKALETAHAILAKMGEPLRAGA
jgi:predicted dehydrogenase